MKKTSILRGALLGACIAGSMPIIDHCIGAVPNAPNSPFISWLGQIIWYVGSPPALLAERIAGSIFNETYGVLILPMLFIYFIVLGVLISFLWDRNGKRGIIPLLVGLALLHGITFKIFMK